MKRFQKLFVIGNLIVLSFNTKSQDLVFSQLYSNNLILSPALAGKIDKDFRLTSNYKNQWRNISESYNNYALTYEMPAYKDYYAEDYLGFGFTYYNDKAGLTSLKLNSYQLALAYHTKTDRYNSVSFGISGAFGRRSIDLTDIKWESQYNGNNYDPSLASGETSLSERYNYWDFNSGLNWQYSDPNLGTELEIGLSVFHLLQPKQNFTDNTNDRLGRRYQIHSRMELDQGSFNLIPQLILSKQRRQFSFIAGSMVKLKPDEPAESKYTDFNVVSYLSFGAFYRYKDAIILSSSYDYKHTLVIGISYDITLSRLRAYNNSGGGFEISLMFNGAFKNNKIKVKNKGLNEKDKKDAKKRDKSF